MCMLAHAVNMPCACASIQEHLHAMQVLFMDEISTGLDSSTTFQVCSGKLPGALPASLALTACSISARQQCCRGVMWVPALQAQVELWQAGSLRLRSNTEHTHAYTGVLLTG